MTEKAHRIGDVVHNRFTCEQGRVVRIYSDLDQTSKAQTSKARRGKLTYIVAVTSGNRTAREALWPDGEVSARARGA